VACVDDRSDPTVAPVCRQRTAKTENAAGDFARTEEGAAGFARFIAEEQAKRATLVKDAGIVMG
jgi:hypothetical protein